MSSACWASSGFVFRLASAVSASRGAPRLAARWRHVGVDLYSDRAVTASYLSIWRSGSVLTGRCGGRLALVGWTARQCRGDATSRCGACLMFGPVRQLAVWRSDFPPRDGGVGAGTLSLRVRIAASLRGSGCVLSLACRARCATVSGAAVCGGCAVFGGLSGSAELGASVLAPRDRALAVSRGGVLVGRGSGCPLFGEALQRLVLLVGFSSRRRAVPRRLSWWTPSGTLVPTPSLGWRWSSVEGWGRRLVVGV